MRDKVANTSISHLEVEDLSFAASGIQILNGISIKAIKGETIGVIGPNGSGKTTLFNCLSGFYKPQKGYIIFNGDDITKLGASSRALKGIGRVFQNSGVFREMTVFENVITAIEGRHSLWSTFFPWNSINKRISEQAFELLEEFRLVDKAQAKASSLSGGQLRLLEIARTLGFKAELFLLDEPTAGVSPSMKDEISKAISKLKAKQKTVLVIEHDIQFIQSFCDRIVVLDSGKVVLEGSPNELKSSEKLKEIYFGGGAVS